MHDRVIPSPPRLDRRPWTAFATHGTKLCVPRWMRTVETDGSNGLLLRVLDLLWPLCAAFLLDDMHPVADRPPADVPIIERIPWNAAVANDVRRPPLADFACGDHPIHGRMMWYCGPASTGGPLLPTKVLSEQRQFRAHRFLR